MRRHLVGVLALVLVLSAAVSLPFAEHGGLVYQFGANALRVGALLGVFWLAYGDLMRIPGWLWAALLPVVVILFIRPRWMFFLIPLALAFAVLHPRIWPSGRKRRG